MCCLWTTVQKMPTSQIFSIKAFMYAQKLATKTEMINWQIFKHKVFMRLIQYLKLLLLDLAGTVHALLRQDAWFQFLYLQSCITLPPHQHLWWSGVCWDARSVQRVQVTCAGAGAASGHHPVATGHQSSGGCGAGHTCHVAHVARGSRVTWQPVSGVTRTRGRCRAMFDPSHVPAAGRKLPCNLSSAHGCVTFYAPHRNCYVMPNVNPP